MENETVAFMIGIVVGLLMLAYPTFILFRPSRKGRWVYNLIGEKNWNIFIRAFGILLAGFSGFFVASAL